MLLPELARLAHVDHQRRRRATHLLPERLRRDGGYAVESRDGLEWDGDSIVGPGQVLALAEGAGTAFIDADRRVEHFVEKILDRAIFGEEVIGGDLIIEAARAHQL